MLAEKITERQVKPDCVLGIPRGGVLIAREVSRALEIPLDVTVPRKIGAPDNPEFAIAAISLDGIIVKHPDYKNFSIPSHFLEKAKAKTLAEIRRRLLLYRGEQKERDVKGLRVSVVDDGIATGLTLLCAVQSLRQRGAQWIQVAVPVSSLESYRRFLSVADDVLALSTPEPFYAVGQFYADFHQVTDHEVLAALGRQ